MNALEELIQDFSKLPGIGKKSAARIAYYLLQTDEEFNSHLASAVEQIQKKIHRCSICGSFTEQDPCRICTDQSRNRNTICVVEEPQDVISIDGTGAYDGLFHVLNGVISPLDGIGPDQLQFGKLINRIKKDSITEIIIATNPTEEGDTTALYLSHLLKDIQLSDAEGKPKRIRTTRLASGLPVGGDLEYADRITLARSLRGRVNVDDD